MKVYQKFTANDFDDLSWHDNKIHGFSFGNDNYESSFELDLDYITSWEEDEFLISPASLIFHDVTDLKLMIDWGDSGYQNAVIDTSILNIERNIIETKLRVKQYYRWDIKFNDDTPKITFGASGFTFVLKNEPVLSSQQFLTRVQRKSK